MNGPSHAGRDPRRRTRFRLAAPAAVLASATLLAAACGGSPSTTARVPTLQDMTTNALTFAKCMRAHGVPDFPDPTVQDNAQAKGVRFEVSASIRNSPQFQPATKVCQKQAGFGQLSPAVLQAMMTAALKFAECMRSHGVTNYPDPVDEGNKIQLGPGPGSSFAKDSPRAQAARRACAPLLPNGGP